MEASSFGICRNPKSACDWTCLPRPTRSSLRRTTRRSQLPAETDGYLDFSPNGRSLAYGGDFNELFLCESGTWSQTQRIPIRSSLVCRLRQQQESPRVGTHERFYSDHGCERRSPDLSVLVEWRGQVPGLVARWPTARIVTWRRHAAGVARTDRDATGHLGHDTPDSPRSQCITV